ncbi:30S ribosomal protein S8 [Blattabacterium cuenoti]|uniref:30S ribosomal protein S8 n=1 Tax=Blattabacterium cuenoti TaxID=1653831 RepID=UPI00163BF17A|nr:30S ribosomal protein S8 [Blattabacterium cuenoti]
MDSIADFITRIRNASFVKHISLEVAFSKMKMDITEVLFKNGYILSYKVDDQKKMIKIILKYYKKKYPIFHNIIRISKPGLRIYCKYKKIPRVLNGLGIAIISTSVGVITDKEARKKKIGGEVLCYVH